MPQLSVSEYRRNFQLEASRLAAIQPNQLSVKAPHLDGWTVRTIIEHTGIVLRFASLAMVAASDKLPSKSDIPAAPEGSAILSWFEESAQFAAQAVDTVDLSSMRPTWTGPQPASWYVRRLAQEVSVHRWDAQVAITRPDPIDADVAVDGIDELLEVYVPRRMNFETLAGNGETVHLHATGQEQGEWLLTFKEDHVAWEHSHTKADVAARGPASDLLLLLWGRHSHTEMETFGDDDLFARWKKAAAF